VATKTHSAEWPLDTELGELVALLNVAQHSGNDADQSARRRAWESLFELVHSFALQKNDPESSALFLVMVAMDLERGTKLPGITSLHISSMLRSVASNPQNARSLLGLGTRGAPKQDNSKRDHDIYLDVEYLIQTGTPLSEQALINVGAKYKPPVGYKRVEQIHNRRREIARLTEEWRQKLKIGFD
jgi:hypothetical protein